MARVCEDCGAPLDDERTHECPAAGEAPAQTVLAGRYALLEVVGRGGGGTVHRAFDRELGLVVALKVLAPEEISGTRLARLKREIRITRDIDHPNVSRVFDLGTSDETTFLTMRFIDGESLARRVRRSGPLESAALARLARGLVSALAAAHRLGVVHRDVKPANVLVGRDGEPVLVDFGIATDSGTTPEARLRQGEEITEPGIRIGTPSYMAPEQANGAPAIAASDLYSLALTIAFAAGASGVPDDPARAFARLPRPMSSLLVRCLSRDPAKRPRDAVALEDALAASARGRRRLRFAGALAFVAVLGAAAVLSARRTDGSGPPRVHVDALENRSADRGLDWLEDGVADLVRSGIEASGRVLVVGPNEGAARIAGAITGGEKASVELRLLAPDGRVLARSRVADAAGDGLFDGVDRAVGKFLSRLGAPPPTKTVRRRAPTSDAGAFAAFERARALVRAHRHDAAIAELRAATARDPAFALAQLWRALLVTTRGLGPRAEAESAFALAREHADRLSSVEKDLLGAVLDARVRPGHASVDRLRAHLRAHPDGTVWFFASGLPGLDPRARRALLEEWAGRLPDDPEPHNQLGYLYLRSGRPDAAEREFREYLRRAPDDPNAHDSYGEFLVGQGRLPEADRAYARALEIDPGFSAAILGGVLVSIRVGDLGQAESRLERLRGVVSPGSPRFVSWIEGVAAVSVLGGDVPGALERLASIERDPRVGSAAFPAHEYAAILRALGGDAQGAHDEALETQRTGTLYHGADPGLPTLTPYVDALAAYRRRDRAGVERAASTLSSLLEPAEWENVGSRTALLRGLARALGGEPSAAAEALGSVPPSRTGAPILAAIERARALVRADRLVEADAAYARAMSLRDSLPLAPEAAYEWASLVEEASVLAVRLGDEARAAAIRTRRARTSKP